MAPSPSPTAGVDIRRQMTWDVRNLYDMRVHSVSGGLAIGIGVAQEVTRLLGSRSG